MGEITRAMPARVGADLAKSVIQVHGVDAAGRRVVGKTIKREQFLAWCAQLPPGCIVAIEACSSAHHWARKLRALGLDVRLIAAHFVSPYRMEGKSGKNDATDAAAICEAGSRAEHAVRADQELRATRADEPASGARGVQGRAHCLHQPHPRRAGRVRPGLRSEPEVRISAIVDAQFSVIADGVSA